MNTETCHGWTNRETWSFMLWTNNHPYTEQLARDVVELETDLDDNPHPELVGRAIVATMRDTLIDALEFVESPTDSEWFLFLTEVGSWDRIDYEEVGTAILRDVLESAE